MDSAPCKLADRLTYDSSVCPDGPIVKGTKVAASAVVSMVVDTDSYARILDRYPELTREDVDACLQFEAEFLRSDAIGDVPAGFAPPDDDEDDRLDALDADLAAGLADTGSAPAVIMTPFVPAPADLCKFTTGAVRSNDRARVRYDLITPIGLRRVAETYHEGSQKYSDFNWEKGMPVHDLLNHAIPHIYLYLSGDRTEDHLAHAAWNLLAACHSEELWPHLNEGTLRRPGCLPPAPKGGAA